MTISQNLDLIIPTLRHNEIKLKTSLFITFTCNLLRFKKKGFEEPNLKLIYYRIITVSLAFLYIIWFLISETIWFMNSILCEIAATVVFKQ